MINGRKMRDSIDQLQWVILKLYEAIFSNKISSVVLSNYSVHLGQFQQTYSSLTLLDHINAYILVPIDRNTV